MTNDQMILFVIISIVAGWIITFVANKVYKAYIRLSNQIEFLHDDVRQSNRYTVAVFKYVEQKIQDDCEHYFEYYNDGPNTCDKYTTYVKCHKCGVTDKLSSNEWDKIVVERRLEKLNKEKTILESEQYLLNLDKNKD